MYPVVRHESDAYNAPFHEATLSPFVAVLLQPMALQDALAS
jgi:hypothetical protein